MQINTKELSSRIKLGTMLITIIILILIVLSLFFSWSKTHLFEYSFISIYIVYIIFIFIKKYYYIHYNTDGPKIIIRYASLTPLSVGNYSIEIPKKDFIRADIKSSFGGLRKELVVYVETPQGVAKFRPISLSILSKNEINSLIDDLS